MSQSPLYEGSILTAAVQSSTNGFPTVNGNGSNSRRNSGIDAGSAAAALYSSADGDCSDCVVKAATAALQAHAVLATSRDVHSRYSVLLVTTLRRLLLINNYNMVECCQSSCR
jgi:hypothetical protein